MDNINEKEDVKKETAEAAKAAEKPEKEEKTEAAAAKDAPAKKSNKKKIILVIVLVAALAAAGVAAVLLLNKPEVVEPESTTEGVLYAVVLDENGEPMTDENGEQVTVEASTDADGNVFVTTPDGRVVQATTAAPKNDTETTAAGGSGDNSGGNDATTEGTTKAPVKKPDAPGTVTGLKATDIEENDITFKWNRVKKCDAYQVSYCEVDDNGNEGTWHYYPTNSITELRKLYVTKNSIKLSDLMDKSSIKPYTEYHFAVRAYNVNEATSAFSPKWSDTISAMTLEPDKNKEREITVNIRLPFDGGVKDGLVVLVWDEKTKKERFVYDEEVFLDGKTVSIPLPEKYKGPVWIKVGLRDNDVYSEWKEVHRYEELFDLSAIGVDVVADDDEY